MPLVVNAASITKKINIAVDGIGDLDLSIKVHDITVISNSNTINITVEADQGATIDGAGIMQLQEGENNKTIKISNGSITEEYTLKINYSKPNGTNVAATNQQGKQNPNTGDTMNMITIASLAIVGISCLIISKKNKKLYI